MCALQASGPLRLSGRPLGAVWGGRCTRCRDCTHALTADKLALQAAEEVAQAISQHGRLDFEAPSPDPRFSIDYVDGRKGPGRMLGVLIASSASGAPQVLKAFSGQLTETWHVPGWVGPVHSLTGDSPVYAHTKQLTQQVTQQLRTLDSLVAAQPQPPPPPAAARAARRGSGSTQAAGVDAAAAALAFLRGQRQRLAARRRGMSHHLMAAVQRSYATADLAGRPVSLLDAYLAYVRAHPEEQLAVTRAGGFTGFPAGTGDCCAPKLLHAAARAGLAPVSMVEFWYGSPPNTATAQGRQPAGGLGQGSTRQHLHVYGPCEKCRAILGAMLCGAGEPGDAGGP